MTKIIFFDIDGTLVSFNTHKIPQSTIDAVHKVRQHGVKVWIATGRPMPFINNLNGLEYDGVMCVNGAHCIVRSSVTNGEKEDKIIYSKPVSRDAVIRMIAEQEKTGKAVVYAGKERAILTAPHGIPEELKEVFTLLDLNIPTLYLPQEALTFEVMQVIAFFTQQESCHIMNDVLTDCNETRWHPSFADCVAMGTDKAAGMDKVIEYYGFDLSETMAFGDGGNDITMLRHASIGVAMGNANDDVKAAADVVTSTVDDDGVARILQML